MHPAAGDGTHIDHGAGRRSEFVDQAARQHEGREEIDLEDVPPIFHWRVQGRKPAAALPLRRDRRIIDQCVQP